MLFLAYSINVLFQSDRPVCAGRRESVATQRLLPRQPDSQLLLASVQNTDVRQGHSHVTSETETYENYDIQTGNSSWLVL